MTSNHRKVFECIHFKFMVNGWSKQTNKPTGIHTCAQCCHASIGLAQVRSNYLMYTYIGSQTQPYNNYSYKPWIGGGKAGPPTWVTVTHLAVHYCRNNVHSNTKSVQLKDCIEWLKVYIIKCSDILRLYLSNGGFLPSITTVKHTHTYLRCRSALSSGVLLLGKLMPPDPSGLV